MLGAASVGALLGSILTGKVVRAIGVGPAYLVGLIVFPAPLLLVPLAAGSRPVVVGTLFLAEFVSGLGVMILDITFGSFAAALIPHRLRARVAGTTRTLNYGIRPVGALLGGALGSAIGVRTTLWIATGGALLGCLWLIGSPIMRLRTLPEGDPEDLDADSTPPAPGWRRAVVARSDRSAGGAPHGVEGAIAVGVGGDGVDPAVAVVVHPDEVDATVEVAVEREGVGHAVAVGVHDDLVDDPVAVAVVGDHVDPAVAITVVRTDHGVDLVAGDRLLDRHAHVAEGVLVRLSFIETRSRSADRCRVPPYGSAATSSPRTRGASPPIAHIQSASPPSAATSGEPAVSGTPSRKRRKKPPSRGSDGGRGRRGTSAGSPPAGRSRPGRSRR